MLYALCAALSLALLGLDQWVEALCHRQSSPWGRPSPFCPGVVELRDRPQLRRGLVQLLRYALAAGGGHAPSS